MSGTGAAAGGLCSAAGLCRAAAAAATAPARAAGSRWGALLCFIPKSCTGYDRFLLLAGMLREQAEAGAGNLLTKLPAVLKAMQEKAVLGGWPPLHSACNLRGPQRTNALTCIAALSPPLQQMAPPRQLLLSPPRQRNPSSWPLRGLGGGWTARACQHPALCPFPCRGQGGRGVVAQHRQQTQRRAARPRQVGSRRAGKDVKDGEACGARAAWCWQGSRCWAACQAEVKLGRSSFMAAIWLNCMLSTARSAPAAGICIPVQVHFSCFRERSG